jgi:PAS domain S-box-containing protein
MSKPAYEELEGRLAELENKVAQLRIQAVYLERLFNSAPEGIIWHDNDDVIVNVNDEFTRMFGYSRIEAIGKRINDLVAPKEYREHAEMFSDMVLHGERIEGDSKRKRKDGTLFDVSILGAPIIHEGRQMGVFAIYRDITERKKAEEEILLQKTYLERLFNSAPEAIVWHDNLDRIVNVNDEFTRMFGYTREEAVGKPINDLLVPAELKEEGARFSTKVISGERIEADTKRMRKDGSLIDVWVIGSPIARGGKQIGDYAIYRDITERKRAEEEVLVQKTYLEKLFNSAPEGIVWHDNEDVVVNVNDEFTKMFGYLREEAVGRKINDLVAPGDLVNEAAMFSHMVGHGDRVAADSKRRRKDGSVFDVSILGAPIFHEGKQIGVYAIYRDVTERKKSEDEILLQKTYLERLFNSAPEAIVLHDNDDRIINVNDEFTRMFGYSREESVGKQINDLVTSMDLRKEAGQISERIRNGERVELESKRNRKDGTLFDVSILCAPIVYNERQIGDYAIYRDITEKKKAEEARLKADTEARTAREIQMNFLPESNPVIPGYSIAGRSIPAANVGGDYYDFIRLDDHRIAIGLGDVSGHGLPSALVMANLQATIRSQAAYDADPARCLERANKLLFHSTDAHTFVSLFYGILDTRKNSLVYANAGQNWPVVFRPGGKAQQLSNHGLVLGVREESHYESEEVILGTLDRMLIYSDGVSEAMNEAREQFGESRLISAAGRTEGKSTDEMLEEIFKTVNAHVGTASQQDDMTLVLLVRN